MEGLGKALHSSVFRMNNTLRNSIFVQSVASGFENEAGLENPVVLLLSKSLHTS